MSPEDYLYAEACEAGDPAGFIGCLEKNGLAQLHARASRHMADNATPGGIPGLIAALCEAEAAQRFLKP